MRFKQFEIRKQTFVGEPPTEDYHKYNFDIVKWSDNNTWCFSIGTLRWNKGEDCFDFESVLTRYLEEREDGLEEWLIAWCQLKGIEYKYEEEE